VLVKVRVPRDGMVLGATVGAGYSAFESAGYALGALIQYTDDRPVLNVLQTEAQRAVLAPFGHITWTAILGGAIFASAWTTGRLQFRGDSLAAAIEEFNRYNRRQLRLADTGLAQLRVGGTFNATDPESFAAALASTFSLRVAHDTDAIVLHPP